jgi:hypothetical protein
MNMTQLHKSRHNLSAGETPWTVKLDLSLSYQMQLAEGELYLSAKVYNVLNADTATQVIRKMPCGVATK